MKVFEKVGKNHVPTCPIFAGPVTFTEIACIHLQSLQLGKYQLVPEVSSV